LHYPLSQFSIYLLTHPKVLPGNGTSFRDPKNLLSLVYSIIDKSIGFGLLKARSKVLLVNFPYKPSILSLVEIAPIDLFLGKFLSV